MDFTSLGVKTDQNGDFIVGHLQGTSMHISNSPDSRSMGQLQEWIGEGNTPEPYVEPEPSWLDKRLANMADGGYGTTGEQFEMIGEQGMEVYQAHIAKVKTDIPKEI